MQVYSNSPSLTGKYDRRIWKGPRWERGVRDGRGSSQRVCLALHARGRTFVLNRFYIWYLRSAMSASGSCEELLPASIAARASRL